MKLSGTVTDFLLDIPEDRPVRLLQITDLQIIDATQRRTPDRLTDREIAAWQPENADALAYSSVRALVERTRPDLIFITGDIVYGEFDDSGRTLQEIVAFLDSLGVPYAPVYGNHDNESEKGVLWQNAQFENGKNCFFKAGTVGAGGNYTVGIRAGGKLIRTLYMLDSQGCGKRAVPARFEDTQLAWVRETAKRIDEIAPDTPAFAAFHIPTVEFSDALIAAGYQQAQDTRENRAFYTIGKDVPARPGEFGRKGEGLYHFTAANGFLDTMKAAHVDGVFAGHCHNINTSVVYDGIRYTFGLKTGLYDYHEDDSLGGTLVTVAKDGFTVAHQYLSD